MKPENRCNELAAPVSPIDAAATEIRGVLDLDECWFEAFPFDRLLPRIEHDRIVLPADEPGVRAYADWQPADGIELPVRFNDLTLGRFVLIPLRPTCGVALASDGRANARAIAARTASWIAREWAPGTARRS